MLSWREAGTGAALTCGRQANGPLPRLRRRPRREQRAQCRHEGQRLVDHHVMLGLGDLDVGSAGSNEAQR